MLSQGRIDTDNVFCLSDGKLRLSLDRESYEKAGLVGKPAAFSGGKKGLRWMVEFDLRSEKMMHGTKALERVIWSFENVLKEEVVFLFCDLEQHKSPEPSPDPPTCPLLSQLPSQPCLAPPTLTISPPSLHPSFAPPPLSRPYGGTPYARETYREWALDIAEYVSLATLPSDRLHTTDKIDPYLSTYSVPTPRAEKPTKIVRIQWRGMLPAPWIASIWNLSQTKLLENPRAESWLAMLVHGFENSPISWDGAAHGCLVGSENWYMCLKPSFSKAPLVSGAAMEEGDDSEYEDGDGDDDDDDEGMDIDTNCVVVNNEGRKKEEIRHKASASNVQCMTWEIVGSQDEHS